MDNILENYTVEYIRENEEEILRKILGMDNGTVNEMRRIYIKNILTSEKEIMHYKSGIDEENIEMIIDEIEKIIIDTKSSVLEFKNLYPGKPVFELANKVIKFNKDFTIPRSRHILAPERKIQHKPGMAMTVFEKLDTRNVIKVNDDAEQIMYNRLRQEGLVWMDVHTVNIGVTENRRDESDDGLRIIDADKIYDYYQLLNSMEPVRNQYGVLTRQAGLEVYLRARGYLHREEAYIRFEKEQAEQRRASNITPTKIMNTSKKVTKEKPGKLIGSFIKVQKLFDRIFNRDNINEK